MASREIIEIDEGKCDGCGACETGCPEGALRVIDGKARLVGESLCDGLGACIGKCPRGAIVVTRREAEAYDEAKVMEGIAKAGPKVIAAHLAHLRSHGQDTYFRAALAWLSEKGIKEPDEAPISSSSEGRCPGSASRRFTAVGDKAAAIQAGSALSHWPIQLHLINPRAPHYAGSNLLVAADCTAFALGSFHPGLLAGKSLVIACPKLDQGREIYLEKLATLLDTAASVTVAIMEVPCCSGLLKLLLEARERTAKKPLIESLVIGIEGGILRKGRH